MNDVTRDHDLLNAIITPEIEHAMATIALELARNAIEFSPENTVDVADAIAKRLKASVPQFSNMDRSERNAIIAGVYYFIGAQVCEILPAIRRIIVEHHSECDDHSMHQLRIKFRDDKPELVS